MNMRMKEERIRHLELIQSAISRMANNSFLLKGWSITLVAALFALAAKDSRVSFAVLALFPSLSFWGLDAYYLRQERLYRALYDAIRVAIESDSNQADQFSMETASYRDSVDSWFKTLWAPTILAIHGTVIVLIIIVIFSIQFIL